MAIPFKRTPAVLCLALAILTLAGCGTGGSVPSAPAQSQPTTLSSAEPTPEQTPEVTPTPEPTPSFPVYEFGAPLEESEPVEDDSFFDNAVFLGDSRTEGLQLFSGLTHGDFFWARGMSVFRADSEKYQLFEIDGESLTLVGTLSKKNYDAVYIMMGVNELGYPAESYEAGLGQLVDKVLAAQPDAVVYLQTLPPVNEEKARSSGLADYINNDNVTQFNRAIVRVAAEKCVVLLDVASIYRGEDGQLPADLTSDGAHFYVKGYSSWADYLRCHVIDPERYRYNRQLDPPPRAPEPEPEPSESEPEPLETDPEPLESSPEPAEAEPQPEPSAAQPGPAGEATTEIPTGEEEPDT